MDTRPTGSSLPRIRTFREDLARATAASNTLPEPDQTKDHVPAVSEPPAPRVKTAPIPATPTTVPPAKPPAPPVAPKPVPPTKPATTASQSVMHDAARELATIDAKRRASVLSSEDDSFDVRMAHDTGAEGSIVTDRKRDRFKLVPAVTAAFHDWLFEKREDLAKEFEPKHTVAPATERKDVIARAAEGGVLAPKNDYETVATRLRHVPRVKVTVKPTVRDAAEVPKPSWHTVEEQEAPEPAPAAHAPRAFVPRPAPVPQFGEEPKPAAPAKPKEPEPVPAPRPEPVPTPIAPVVPDAPTLRNETPAPVRVSRATTASAPQPAARRVLPYALVAIAIVAIIAGGGAVYLVANRIAAPSSDTHAVAVPVNGVPVSLSGSRDAFIATLAAAIANGDRGGVTWFVPVTESGAAADPQTVLATLDLSAPGAFTRSVSVLRFGAYHGTDPFLVLTVPNFDTGLGGMLAWEDAIVPDLAPLFGNEVGGTLIPTATSSAVTAPAFVDTTHANRDLRVLYDEAGAARVTYTFLNRTTILITTTPAAIDAIAPSID